MRESCHAAATRIHDAEENSGIPAGYTYLGQFIDHDITFDPTSSLDRQNDPDALVELAARWGLAGSIQRVVDTLTAR